MEAWQTERTLRAHRSTSSLLNLGKHSTRRRVNNLKIMCDRETVNKSYGYTGKGVATYPNGDVYEGTFVNGVRDINLTANTGP